MAVSSKANVTTVSVSVPLTLSADRNVIVHSTNGATEQLSLRHLPPVSLTVTLPHDYPETASPHVLVTSCIPGLPPRVRAVIDRNKGNECLFELVQAVSSEELEPSLEWPAHIRTDSPDRLREYDARRKNASFQADRFLCGICLEEQKGRACVKLQPCGDVFCASCLRDYFALLITEGLVLSVSCPGTACTAASATQKQQLDVEQVRSITCNDELAESVCFQVSLRESKY